MLNKLQTLITWPAVLTCQSEEATVGKVKPSMMEVTEVRTNATMETLPRRKGKATVELPAQNKLKLAQKTARE